MMPLYHSDLFPFMGLGGAFAGLLSLVVAFLVYKDAQKRGMNGLLWGLPMLIPWIGVLFLILYLILRDSGRTIAIKTPGEEGAAHERPEPSALDILDARYAREEVSREKYLEMKEDIKKQT